MTQPSKSVKNAFNNLQTTQGWIAGLVQRQMPGTGGLIAINVTGLGTDQAYQRDMVEAVLAEIVTRVRKALPGNAVLLRGSGDTVIVWLPGMTDIVVQAFVTHLRQIVAVDPIITADGVTVVPRFIMSAISVEPGTRAKAVFNNLENALISQPDNASMQSGISSVISALDELDRRIATMQLFGQDKLIEQVILKLKLPNITPQVVILSGLAQAGKSRILTAIVKMLGGQRLPIAEVKCHPGDQAIPFSLLSAIIAQFFNFYPTDQLRQRFTAILQAHPWLAGIFQALRTEGEPELPPEELSAMQMGFEVTLVELFHNLPHVAIVHEMELGDTQSLNLLGSLMNSTGHGFRLIAGIEQDGELPEPVRLLMQDAGSVIAITPLSEEQVLTYLGQIASEIAQEQVAAILKRESGGLLLSIEYTLRSWVEEGRLTFNNGRWEFHEDTVKSQLTTGLSPLEQSRLGKAALAGPIKLDLLMALWDALADDARAVIDRGRALGYLKQENPQQPDIVEFMDADHAGMLAKCLSREERMATHAKIGLLLETMEKENAISISPNMAYHFTQAGETEKAQTYANVTKTQLPKILPDLITAEAMQVMGAETWNIPPAEVLEEADLPRIVEAVSLIRLAGIQLRLYPPSSETVRFAIRDAVNSLDKLLANRSSLIITYDGHTVAYDGQIISRRDLSGATRDFEIWMSEGNLYAIGIARGVRDYELLRFLQTLANYEPREGQSSLLTRVSSLSLINIKVLSRTFQANLPHSDITGSGFMDVPTLPPSATDLQRRPDGRELSLSGIASLPPKSDTMLKEVDDGTIPTLANPENIAPELWIKLPEMVATSSAHVRRVMMANLAHWLDDLGPTPSGNLPEHMDSLIIERLEKERDSHVLSELLISTEKRLTSLLQFHQWKGIVQFITPLVKRLDHETSQEAKRQINVISDRAGELIAQQDLIEQLSSQPENQSLIRDVVMMMGTRILNPIVTRLKSTNSMQERKRLMQVLGEFGNMGLSVLTQELRDPNPWFVYRNILQVLSEIGNEDMLGVISEKIKNPDPRVRAEAVTTAVRIGKENSIPYLIQGLEDNDESVRARAATLAGLYPHQRILEILLRLLRRGEDTEAVQMAAVLALGQFNEPSARDALLQILQSRMFSSYGKMTDEIRAAAITALSRFMEDSATQLSIKQAMNDRSAAVRQSAQRVWQQNLTRISGT